MLKRSCLAAVLWLATLSSPAGAQVVPYNLSYAMLQQIFVQNQQYFVLDDEGFNDPSLNHLHFTTLDTTTGAFTGTLWAPVLLPAVAPQTVPVTGTMTIHPGVSDIGGATGGGDHLEITFTWSIESICSDQSTSYHGAIAFLGYLGAKMRAKLAGVITSFGGGCGIGIQPYSPQPFSGLLTK